MGFDLLARHYRWMEFVLAGGKLQRCRTAFLGKIHAPSRILLVGEGNGRFLTTCRLRFPTVPITVIDASPRMLAEAKERMADQRLSSEPIDYVQADILEWEPSGSRFELVVTHFFLDCFPPEQLSNVVKKLATAASSRARWLLADFQVPQNGVSRLRARLIHALMYAFFRTVTGLRARQLTPPDAFLQQHGFVLEERRTSEWGLLHSDCWVRNGLVRNQ